MIDRKAFAVPGYPLEDRRVVTTSQELKALAHPVRGVILDLLLERAATITELAKALGRPKSTVAFHVSMLVDADMLKVVSTRKVRAIDERSYGRTARLFAVGDVAGTITNPPLWRHPLDDARRASEAAYREDTMWSNTRHSRIDRAQAREFWTRVEELVEEFSHLTRQGEDVFGFTVALYPTDFPVHRDPGDESES